MKKVWALEKHYTKEENISLLKDLLDSISASALDESDREKLTKSVQERIDTADETWNVFIANKNYYTFCGKAKEFLREKDAAAIKSLKDELGKVPFSSEINDKFRKAHCEVRDSYRVVEAEVSDNWTTDRPWENYNVVKVNDGVYKYLWNSK